MDPIAIILLILLFVGLGIGGYFGYKNWWEPSQCNKKAATANVATWVWNSNVCQANTCTSGFTFNSDKSDCVKDTSCPANCSDTTCTNIKCEKCNPGYGTKLSGSPDSSGMCPEYWKEIDTLDYRGPSNDISFSTTSDKDECISKCAAQKNPDCMFAVTDGTSCWLKNGFGSDGPKGSVITGRSVLAPVTFSV